MRILLGLEAPTSGRALIGGRRYQAFTRPLRRVGSVLDATAVPAGRAAWFYLLSLAQSNGIGRRRVIKVPELTGLRLPPRPAPPGAPARHEAAARHRGGAAGRPPGVAVR